ncbi:MAG: alpha/beta hydrolase [Cryobacterium sp.]|nr:alpha/beta hydrolase [Cryobacterium sp.]
MNWVAKGWWWFLDYLWALRGQWRGLLRPRAPHRFGEGDPALPTVVLIPGVYERWSFLAPVADHLNERGHRILTLPGLRDNRMPVLDAAEASAAALIVDAQRSDAERRYVLLGHSKGGLIGKLLLGGTMHSGTMPPILGLVAIATPFTGSRYARRLPSRTLRGLSPVDDTIRMLARNAEINARVVAIQPRFDPHIPGDRSLPGAENVVLRASGHFRILGRPETFRVVHEAIERLAGGAGGPARQ